ncbi:MAG: ABC transporter permease [Myxococcales bacterium]|nr:ABC transporter permease [Myxococcales bacterium]
MGAYAPSIPAIGTLWLREVRAFVRTRSRVIGALATPVVFWFLFGSGIGRTFVLPGSTEPTAYFEFFFPGAMAMVVLFTAIFATISLIEDRHEGFLQSVLVAPIHRADIVMGKVLGGTTLALGQALIFLCFAPFIGFRPGLEALVLTIALLALIGFGLTSLGFYFAWKLDSVQGYHSIMNLVLFPMWFLSGALFPIDGAAPWLRYVMYANPLTYGVAGLRHLQYLGRADAPAMAIGWPLAVGVTAAFALVTFLAAVLATIRSAEKTLT